MDRRIAVLLLGAGTLSVGALTAGCSEVASGMGSANQSKSQAESQPVETPGGARIAGRWSAPSPGQARLRVDLDSVPHENSHRTVRFLEQLERPDERGAVTSVDAVAFECTAHTIQNITSEAFGPDGRPLGVMNIDGPPRPIANTPYANFEAVVCQ